MTERTGLRKSESVALLALRKNGPEACKLAYFAVVGPSTARSVEDETRNAGLNGIQNPEWWGDFSQLVKIEKIKFLGISRCKVQLRF